MGADGANPPPKVPPKPCSLCAFWISFAVGLYLGVAIVKGVFGLSTALRGLFSYPCLAPPSPGLTFSALFCFLEKVEMERAGRDAVVLALDPAFLSGEKDSARVADGVLLCEDEVRDESLVRKEALRERLSVVPISATEVEMLCLEPCFLRGGVDGTIEGAAKTKPVDASPVFSTEGRSLGLGGVMFLPPTGVLDALFLPLKKEGLLKKLLPWEEETNDGGVEFTCC